MMKNTVGLLISITCISLTMCSVESSKKVLILHDELPQMEVLADFLNENGIETDIVEQDSMPADFSVYDALIGYIHRDLKEAAESKIIAYTEQGGKYICLHHSISSRKAENKYYFDFLGIQLDGTEKSNDPELPGEGYAWYDPVDLVLVNLDPSYYVTNHKINWRESLSYSSSDFPSAEREYPSFTMPHTEVYMNHKFTDGREKKVLIGFKFFDERNSELFMQDRVAWHKSAGDGEIYYFMPGHSAEDFQDPNFSQMILNAIRYHR